ncbi:hypothetical protein [Nocardioides sp.]|uniref:hypothetical protein n=1 Tax=Nocardioides sp. TaxID=35761 RepID=UPI002BE7B82D|nr:hypothetical protein [Nocardioides sp.]HSX67226.1 hypothetical protein [Nocardioides sp.]
MKLEDLRGRLSLTVREYLELSGAGRDSTYAAVKNGDLPAIKVCGTTRIPTFRLLTETYGIPADIAAQVIGLPQADSEAGPASPTIATVHALTKSTGGTQDDTPPAA